MNLQYLVKKYVSYFKPKTNAYTLLMKIPIHKQEMFHQRHKYLLSDYKELNTGIQAVSPSFFPSNKVTVQEHDFLTKMSSIGKQYMLKTLAVHATFSMSALRNII